MSENTQVCVSNKDWSQLMDMTSARINIEMIKYGRHEDEHVEWRNNTAGYKINLKIGVISVLN